MIVVAIYCCNIRYNLRKIVENFENYLSLKLARDSGGLMFIYSISDNISTFVPSLAIVQDKILSRIARPQTPLHVLICYNSCFGSESSSKDVL